MMDLATIKQVNEEKCNEAKENNVEPFVIENQEQIDSFKGFPFPHIGDYRPKGWKLIETYFVDSSGFGAEDESALSFRKFLDKLRVGYGYAITEAGQFQVYVGEFRKSEKDNKFCKDDDDGEKYRENDSKMRTTVGIAKLGELFGKDKKEKNDWKKRMLNAGLKNSGLSFPDDWDKLSEDEKETRLNKSMQIMKK